MGHIEPGHAPRSAVSVPDAAETEALWETWRALVHQFRMSQLLRHLMKSGTSLGIYGVDLVSSLRGTVMAHSALGLLADQPAERLDRLARLAEVNARRSDAMWRLSALFYVTVPLTLFLAGLEGAPDFIGEWLRAMGWVGVVLLALMICQLLWYFAAAWRARQIEAVIDLARIERGSPCPDA